MPKVHRVGDFDTSGAMSSTGSDDVYINGGPTLGGTLSEVFDTEDMIGVTDEEARKIRADARKLKEEELRMKIHNYYHMKMMIIVIDHPFI